MIQVQKDRAFLLMKLYKNKYQNGQRQTSGSNHGAQNSKREERIVLIIFLSSEECPKVFDQLLP